MTTETLIAGTASTEAGTQQGADGGNPAATGTPANAAPADSGQQTPGPQGEVKEGAQGEKTSEELSFTDLEMPEGVTLDEARLGEFTTIAKELGLPKDGAKKLVDLAVKHEAARIEAHQKVVGEWAESVKTDKELGGDKLSETLATAKKAIDLGPPELKELLNASGLGNHPAVVRWAYSIGKALSEDRFVTGRAGAVPTGNTDADRASRLYGSTANR